MKTVIEMARKAGIEQVDQDVEEWICFTDELERFAELVRADEREQIIDLVSMYGGSVDLEAAIRARSNT